MNLSLKDFTIELCDYYLDDEKTIERPIRLSSLIQGVASTTGVYNEKLTEKENNQYSLTFNIEMFVDNARNPLIDFIVIDRKIRLKREGSKNIEFYITGKTPTFSNKGVSYAITCQDAFSYQFARQAIKLSLNTNDEEQWGEYNTGPKPIDELVEKVLQLSYLTSWHVNADINNHIYQFPNNLYFGVEPMKVSVEINESTPYNIILEIAKLFNAAVVVNYDLKELNFLNREKLVYNGLKLKPEVNLSQFSYSEKGDNLYNIMYVSGGKDAYGNYLSISPSLPLIVGKILTETARDNEQIALPLLTSENFVLYPSFCRISSEPKVVYAKKRIDNTYLYVRTNIEKYWEDSENVSELKAFVMQCYGLLNNADKKDSDNEELTMFFRKLERVPHASPFLCNFDYWKKTKLLSSIRYKKLMNLINKDMRNVNLMLMSYSNTFNIFNFKLNQMIQEEEEIIALMAAEDTANANNTTQTTSISATRYLSQCVWTDTVSPNLNNAYFPIGILDPSDRSRVDVLYGRNLESSFQGYSMPDFSSIRANKAINYYCINDNKAKAITPVLYNDDKEIITFDPNTTITSDTIYIKYADLQQYINDSPQPRVNYNRSGIADNKIVELQCRLAALWNDDYVYYYRSLYGDNWLQDKIRKINDKRQKYLDKKKSLEKELTDRFGDWQNLDTAKFPAGSTEYITYADLVQQLEDASVYVGGTGKRTYKGQIKHHYDYKGTYNYYVAALQTLDTNSISYSSRPLIDIINEFREKQEKLEQALYRDYSDIIRETHYNDNTQITDDGLYAAAYKQFMTYQQPTKSYSSTYITNYDLEDVGENVEIGDLVELQYQHINEELDHKSFIIKTDSLPTVIKNIVVKYENQIENELDEVVELSQPIYENVTYERQENNRLLIKMGKYNAFDIENSMIKEIYINGEIFNAYNYNSIEALEKVYKSEPVKLRVTGVTKDLRSKVAQLTVEENTLYNTLVDRLIYFLQG